MDIDLIFYQLQDASYAHEKTYLNLDFNFRFVFEFSAASV